MIFFNFQFTINILFQFIILKILNLKTIQRKRIKNYVRKRAVIIFRSFQKVKIKKWTKFYLYSFEIQNYLIDKQFFYMKVNICSIQKIIFILRE